MRVNKRLVTLAVAVIFVLSSLLIPVVSQVSPARADVTWTKYEGEVTLDNSEKYVVDAWVIKDGTTYRMWYTHGETDLNVFGIVDAIIAIVSSSSIIDNIAGLNFEQFLSDLTDLDVSEIEGLLDGSSTVIGYATSDDGKTWTVEESEVLAGSGGAWNSVGAPCVIKVSDIDYRMWYTRVETDLNQADLEDILTNMGTVGQRRDALLDLVNSTRTVIEYATSSDGIDWGVPEEVLAGSGSAWDSVADPCVIKVSDDDYRMWYTSGRTDVTQADLDAIDVADFHIADILDILDVTSTVIGYTTSDDGKTWATPEEVLAGSGGAWNSVAAPCVIKDSSTYRMWYTSGRTDLLHANFVTLLDEIAGLVDQFWTILDDFAAGDFEELLTDLDALNISTIKSLLDSTNTAIGYATSSNGTDWDEQSSQHLVGSSYETWSSVAAPSVIQDGSTYKMWYTEGIEAITLQNLLNLVLGGDLPVGYASYTVPTPAPPSGGAPSEDPWPPSVTEVPAELGTTDVSDVVTEEGVFTEEVTVVSEDANIEAIIEEGTIGLTAEGAPLSEITVVEVTAPSPPPAGANIAALVYDFGPDGATFEPPIEVTFTCNIDLAALPEGTVLVVVQWDEAAGAWVDIEVAPEDYIIDTVANTVTVPISHFSKYSVITRLAPLPLPAEEIIPPAPAAFSVSNFTIQPVEVQPKEAVIITISVANTGDLAGTYKVSLKINNVVVDTKDVTLDGGASQKVTFTTSKDVAGSYTVNVDALAGTFVVKAPSVPPKPINWWLIGGIIAGCIIIAVVIILVVRRRRY